MKYIIREDTLKRAKAKTKADLAVRSLLFAVCLISALSVIFIIIFIFIRGMKPFVTSYDIDGEKFRVNMWSFLTGNEWHRGVASYSVGYIILNTIYVAILTMLLTAPISIFTALVIVRMSNRYFGAVINSVIEILAAIPSVIYGMFGMGVITKWAKGFANVFGIQTAGGLSTFSVVMVLTMMSVPTVTMLTVTSLKAVNKNLVNGSLALGASRSETNFKVILPAAKSGIFAGLIMGLSRALGEATAVTMVAGNAIAGPNFSIFSTTRTLTSTMLTGLSEASGLAYDIRFSVGIVLIFIIIGFNLLLNLVNKRLGRGSR